MKSTTNPNLYIIESLELDDEDENRFEGRLLADMLVILGKQPIYKYIRTSQEFDHYFEDFCNSDYRYLHISCHGSKSALATTFSEMMFEDLADIMKGKLKGKRLFISACEAVNDKFANLIIPSSGCNSIIGPTTKLYTNDALVFWASFYHLVFKANPSAINMEIIKGALKGLLKIHTGFDFKYYYKSKEKVKQIALK